MSTAKIRMKGLELLSKPRMLKADVAEYVTSVNELLESLDADVRLDRAIENSRRQLEYIFGLVKEFKR